ncbi:MAG: enoyl-CoA hydratase-related protein, partial [Terracidiphilus sp.]
MAAFMPCRHMVPFLSADPCWGLLCYSLERMEFSNIRLDLRPPIAQVTLDRPKVLNALNSATLAELAAAFEALAADDA